MNARRVGRVCVARNLAGVFAVALLFVLTSDIHAAKRPKRVQPKRPTGRELFERVWVANDPRSHDESPQSTLVGDGLGPVFNDVSCVACHSLGGVGGAGGHEKNVPIIFMRKDREAEVPKLLRHSGLHTGGRGVVVHRYGVAGSYRDWRKNFVRLASKELESLDIVLSRPAKEEQPLAEIPIPRAKSPLFVSERNPTALFGAGLIDAIPDSVIREMAFSQREQHPQLAGRFGGKFGWEGHTATLKQFVETACAVELGLQNPGHRQASDPSAKTKSRAGNDLLQADCDALLDFVAGLPQPISSLAAQGQPHPGEKIFLSADCAVCHVPKLGDVSGIYSDLLVHDMGQRLQGALSVGGYSAFVASAEPRTRERNSVEILRISGQDAETLQEPRTAIFCFCGNARATLPPGWRTPPLWGVASSAPYLHDGRAATLRDAIQLHAGQGQGAADKFRELSRDDQALLIGFLETLVAPAPDATRAVAIRKRPPSAQRTPAKTATVESKRKARERANDQLLESDEPGELPSRQSMPARALPRPTTFSSLNH